MQAGTAFAGSTGIVAHVADTPVYVAPSAHVFEVAPAGHPQIAPPGRTQPHEASSGIGIALDRTA